MKHKNLPEEIPIEICRGDPHEQAERMYHVGISDEDFQCSLDARKEISPEKRGRVSPALRTES